MLGLICLEIYAINWNVFTWELAHPWGLGRGGLMRGSGKSLFLQTNWHKNWCGMAGGSGSVVGYKATGVDTAGSTCYFWTEGLENHFSLQTHRPEMQYGMARKSVMAAGPHLAFLCIKIEYIWLSETEKKFLKTHKWKTSFPKLHDYSLTFASSTFPYIPVIIS